MIKEFSGRRTSELLAISAASGTDSNDRFAAEQELIKRWNKGEDLEGFIDLLASESSRDRCRAAYYLTELMQRVEGLDAAVVHLADDVIADCRHAFVDYAQYLDDHDHSVSMALAQLLLDMNVYVRLSVIKWAVRTSAERCELFIRLVEGGAGRPKLRFRNPRSREFWDDAIVRRALRGVDIIRRLRAGEKVQQIRNAVTEEDSSVFDSFEFEESRAQRFAHRKK
jgi:hypothetical protein